MFIDEMFRLYKSLGEYDVVNAILSKHVTTHPVTLQAIDAEVRGDYTLAAKLYNQVIVNAGTSPCSSCFVLLSLDITCRLLLRPGSIVINP